MTREPSPAAARALHQRSLVALSYMNPSPRYGRDGSIDYGCFFSRSSRAQGSFCRLRRGNVDVAVLGFGLNEPDRYPGREGVARVVQDLASFHRAVREHNHLAGIARSTGEIRKLRRDGKMAFILQLTGVYLDGALDLLDAYGELGVRMIHPPFDTRAGRDIRAWQTQRGLTAFDRRVLHRMQDLGMAIDLSHASDRMVREALDLTTGPVLVSHGMCRSICPTRRNLTDDQIRAIAATGGFIGIHFAGQLIDPDYGRRLDASGFREELARWVEDLKRRYPDPRKFARIRYDIRRWERSLAYELYQSVPPPDIDRVVDHLDHMVDLAGIDCVCIGSDYDLGNTPEALNGADKLPALTLALRRRGYSQGHVRKVLGANFMRLLGQVSGS